MSGTSVQDFGWEMDLDEDCTERLLDGRLEITDELAGRLQTTLGVPASFWQLREAHYRKDMRRIAESMPSDVAKAWLRDLPVKDMARFGWIEDHVDTTLRLAECLRYFDVPSIDSFDRRVDRLLGGAKLRASASFKSNPASLTAWLRKGEIEAELTSCESWSADKLLASLPELRRLTLLRDPKKFIPQLKAICAESGIAFVAARPPSGCRASGATKFVSDDKALLMLSFRHLSDDHFWFSFFHECGHLILHGRDGVFIEGEPHDTRAHEDEANLFAEKALIPDPWHGLLTKLPARRDEVIRFAVRVGVAPGIVVGQLQHRKRLGHNYLNYLKRRFTWV